MEGFGLIFTILTPAIVYGVYTSLELFIVQLLFVTGTS
jgi:hypothetical protein